VSYANTASEHVASKPIPLTEAGSAPELASTARTHVAMARQMSVVDCSCACGMEVSAGELFLFLKEEEERPA
jgi:hypothetical protein